MGDVCRCFGALSLAQPAGRPGFGAFTPPRVQPGFASAPARTLVIAEAQNSLRRQRTAEAARMRNKSRKTEAKTRSKKVLTAVEYAKFDLPQSEADLAELDRLLGAAYKAIDRAVSKAGMHKNTAARRKSKLALARQNVLVAAGLYKPAGSAPEAPAAETQATSL
ncbi:hypothetical protein QBZ16_003410 [Prototheca wickerhamii]|uniref:30S ribosomal protein S20 n=1 Tax=Prototheca wickerhamii TaxID=3111 RepID=A0AAD9MKR9_PROWI|nr:hypothetical protein QBZ16_003410 [Prototheca wickerhamii]